MKVRPLPAALRKKAEEEINEDPQRVAADLKTLRNWFVEQPHLRSVQPIDQWLIAFLRGNKYRMEKAKEKLEKYYSLKTSIPEIYANRDPFDPKIQELLKLGLFLPLRQCAQEDSPRTILWRASELSKSEYSWVDLIKVGFMIVEILMLEDDNFTIAGENVISDMKNVGFALLSQFTPTLVRNSFICVGVLTVRMNGIYIINSPGGLNLAVTILKMFSSAKLKKRIYTYKENYDDIYDFTPKSILPAEFGGNYGNIQELTDYWKTKVESYRNWFLQHEEVNGVDSKTSDE